MQVAIPLSDMTTAEKLKAMELLWDDLKRSSGVLASPKWHKPVLQGRTARVRKGTATFSTWATAKERIRAATK